MARRTKRIRVTVNGERYEKEVSPSKSLLDFLRMDLNLTGTKEGCGEGECGACSIIMNGKLVDSCLILTVEADGQKIQTIEGISRHDRLHPLQKAFAEKGAAQCGYCTPGMIMAAKYLLDHNPSPTAEQVLKAIAGNLCRCTGYGSIVDAVLSAAKER
ncbi:MAG: (2Fe-2S)-binding protein [Deltaproteobacteria bacterium RIFCSPLOWO2_02_56_12]|nr:MAG: (2Fe-2S)-binding protein [Deltaproteobacteria bacterium RIFCSPLOWO2_02_56_12]HBA40212.1 (2Fe-2S)-binding protein [Deltaproteobacteria bacterium]